MSPAKRDKIQYRNLLKMYQDDTYGVAIQDRLEKGTLLRTIGEIQEDISSEPKPQIGYWWGDWAWENDNVLYLYTDGVKSPIYYIRLEKVSTVNDIMFWVFHMVNKQWVTREIVGDLFMALCDIKKEMIKEIIT